VFLALKGGSLEKKILARNFTLGLRIMFIITAGNVVMITAQIIFLVLIGFYKNLGWLIG